MFFFILATLMISFAPRRVLTPPPHLHMELMLPIEQLSVLWVRPSIFSEEQRRFASLPRRDSEAAAHQPVVGARAPARVCVGERGESRSRVSSGL